MKMLSRLLLVFSILFLSSILEAANPSWTVFHGFKGDNISPETGLLKSWSAEGPKLIWKAEGLGDTEFPGYSSVTISDGRIFTAGNVRLGDSDQTANAFLFALDAKTGKEIWRYSNGSGWTNKGHYPGERSTPTVDGDRVYTYSAIGRLACVHAVTGQKIWDRNIQEDYVTQLPTWAFAESVIVDGDKVICWSGGVKASVVALDKMTGKTIWETPSNKEIGNYATMTIFEHDGIRIYANMNQKGLLGVRADTGEKLFFHPHETQFDIMATTPYYFNGKILVSSGYAKGTALLQLTTNDGKISLKELWSEKKFDNQHGGIIVKDGYIYGAAHRYKKGIWMCLKLEDGSIAWEHPGIGQGSIAYADGLLYCFSEKDGTVSIVKTNPEKYEEVSRFSLAEEGSGLFWAHPVICDKKLYLRHAGFLYCYNIAAD
ncbi:MAG: PQQ-binding-like beta-propeller repeat protein [Planctomycetaceae bacterium]|jgi:outer membrane protein assembly factor BamB|nr:PQQ-binding-like beta-propeller repeat protein [Planctomycetaceae bacterium]